MIEDSESNNTDTNPNPEYKQPQQQKPNINAAEIFKEVTLEKSEKNNEESFANLSENEVKGLITPDKDSGNTVENTSPAKKSELRSYNYQSTQNYNSYAPAQYSSNKVNHGNNDAYMNRQTPIQYQHSYTGRMAGSYMNGYNNSRINTGYMNTMSRPIITGIGANKFQMNNQKPQQASLGINDSKLQHYSKIIDDLKDENKMYKQLLENGLKQKDFYSKSMCDEYKEVIKQKNELLSHQNQLIAQLTRNYS